MTAHIAVKTTRSAVIDTNYLIRLITQDLPDLATQAAETIGEFATQTILLPDAVLAEIAVVLKINPHYRYPREVICEALESLVSTRQFALTSAGRQAVAYFSTTNLDFVDCLVIAEQKVRQLPTILSFDKLLLKKAASL